MPKQTITKCRYFAALAVFAFLVFGVAFAPRPATDISAQAILEKAIQASRDNPDIPIDLIRRELLDGCTPTLAGQSRVDKSFTWPVRLKPPNRRYPWVGVWVDQKSYKIVAWKCWDRPGRQAIVTRQSTANLCP